MGVGTTNGSAKGLSKKGGRTGCLSTPSRGVASLPRVDRPFGRWMFSDGTGPRKRTRHLAKDAHASEINTGKSFVARGRSCVATDASLAGKRTCVRWGLGQKCRWASDDVPRRRRAVCLFVADVGMVTGPRTTSVRKHRAAPHEEPSLFRGARERADCASRHRSRDQKTALPGEATTKREKT